MAGGGAGEPKKVDVSTDVGRTLLEDRGKKSWNIIPQKPEGWWLVAAMEEERVLLELSRREAMLMSFHTSSMNCLADGGVWMTGEEGEMGEEADEHVEGEQEFPMPPLLLIAPGGVRMVET